MSFRWWERWDYRWRIPLKISLRQGETLKNLAVKEGVDWISVEELRRGVALAEIWTVASRFV